MASGTRRLTTGALAISSTSPNLLADDTLRYPGQPSSLEVAAAVDSTGLGDQTLVVEVGNQTVFTGIVPVEGVAGQGPLLPDNIMCRTGVAGGDQISIRVVNADGVATPTTIVLADVTPV